MRESSLVAQIKKHLTSRGHLVYKHHGGAYSVLAHPDLYGILTSDNNFGRFFAIEVKTPGNEPSIAQLRRLEHLEDHGALAFWTDSLDKVKQIIP